MHSGRQRGSIECSIIILLEYMHYAAIHILVNIVQLQICDSAQSRQTVDHKQSSEPRNVYFPHLRKIHRIRCAGYQIHHRLHDWRERRIGILSVLQLQSLSVLALDMPKYTVSGGAYLFTLVLASHGLSPLDDCINVGCDAHSEVHVDLKDLATAVLVHPSHYFISREQAELLLKFTLR